MTPSPRALDRIWATPAARRRAAEKAVDLSIISPRGDGIRLRDVPTATQGAPAASTMPATSSAAGNPTDGRTAGSVHKMSRIRRLTAERTAASLRESAQLTQTFEVDMTAVATLRTEAKEVFARRWGLNLTFLPFVAKAVIDALALHPNINASIDEAARAITHHARVSLGIAVDTPRGLFSPVIPHADALSLSGLAREIAALAESARAGTLPADRLSGGTFTITNIGSQGALFDTPILISGQAAMLGFGAIVRRPVIVTNRDGQESIGIRSMCYLPLTYDHRLIDGADAGRFLTTVKKRLETGLFHADLGV